MCTTRLTGISLEYNSRLRRPFRQNDDVSCQFIHHDQESVFRAPALAGSGHFFWPNEAIKFRRAHKSEAQGFLAQRRAIGMRCLGNLRGFIVADPRCERGDQHQRPLHEFADARFVSANSRDTVIGERVHRITKQADRLQHAVGEHRLVNVEFEMSLASRNCHGGVVAEDLAADHGQRLALGRVGFAWHDR